jgi:hypothetical protein
MITEICSKCKKVSSENILMKIRDNDAAMLCPECFKDFHEVLFKSSGGDLGVILNQFLNPPISIEEDDGVLD